MKKTRLKLFTAQYQKYVTRVLETWLAFFLFLIALTKCFDSIPL